MGLTEGISIKKGKIGVNVHGSEDSISGLVITAVETAATKDKVFHELRSVLDAERLGIDAKYDQTNNLLVHRHISEFYRMAGEGTKLFVHFAWYGESLNTIVSHSSYRGKLLSFARGKIRQLAFVSFAGFGDTLNALPVDVREAITSAQALAQEAYKNHMPCQILLDGRGFNGVASAAQDLCAIENLKADKVSLVIGQDYDYAETKTGVAQKFSDIGTVLGVLARARVNQNIGEVGAFNLTDSLKRVWITPGLSSHQKISDAADQLDTLDEKGYIFGMTYPGIAGVRLNNDHVCTPLEKDREGNINEHTIAYGRTLDKAVRLLRAAYLPKIKSTHPIDPKTGKLPVGVVKNFEGIGDAVLADMISAREISAGKTYVDAHSDLIGEKVLKVQFRIIPYGAINAISAEINLKTSL